MKNSNSIIAIIGLAIVAIAVAFVSCKKETEKALSQKDYSLQQAADIRQMDDPRSYFIDFKKKLTESKSDEAYNLDDAAWHLACLANFDFCKVNVDYDNVQFDTVEMQVNVTDGVVLLSDLHNAYEQMCTEIQLFKKGFNHCNQNLYFINVFINENGSAKIALMTTFINSSKDIYDHLWYFPNTFSFNIDSVCDYYFSGLYKWDGRAITELQRILNLFEHHSNSSGEMCFTPTRNYIFEYPNWTDSYGSPFGDLRLYAGVSAYYYLNPNEMCYCLDSYLGLGYDYLTNNYYVNNEHPICWTVNALDSLFPYHHLKTYYHSMNVQYGQLNQVGPEPGPFD